MFALRSTDTSAPHGAIALAFVDETIVHRHICMHFIAARFAAVGRAGKQHAQRLAQLPRP